MYIRTVTELLSFVKLIQIRLTDGSHDPVELSLKRSKIQFFYGN